MTLTNRTPTECCCRQVLTLTMSCISDTLKNQSNLIASSLMMSYKK